MSTDLLVIDASVKSVRIDAEGEGTISVLAPLSELPKGLRLSALAQQPLVLQVSVQPVRPESH